MRQSKLVREARALLKTEARKMGKPIAWYKFARQLKSGCWKFIPDREDQWEKLEKIAGLLSDKYPAVKLGKIVDILCDIVNRSTD